MTQSGRTGADLPCRRKRLNDAGGAIRAGQPTPQSASVQRDIHPELTAVGIEITRADSVVDASTSE